FKVAGDAANAWNKAAINEQADLDNITEQIQNLLNGQIGGATDGLKEGNIIATNPIWKDGIASITLSKGENVASNLTIQYQIGGVEEHNWISETVGANSVTVTGLQHGNVVYARLTDGTRNGSYASTNILDKLPPENAKIELGGQSTTTARSITATVIHTDNESGVELTKCKWIYNQSQNSIGTEETSYTNTFSDSQPIALRATTPGTYYLHVLTVDKAGNKTETISQVVTVIQLVTGITLDQTSVTIGEGETVQLTATVKPNNASNQSITWSSDDDTIASVSDTGLITAKTAGTVTITVKANDESNKSTECSITVKKLATNVNEIEKKDYVLYP
ncbi:MAG: Ig-like domain-containing protein, partial [Intestinibacter sp.]